MRSVLAARCASQRQGQVWAVAFDLLAGPGKKGDHSPEGKWRMLRTSTNRYARAWPMMVKHNLSKSNVNRSINVRDGGSS